MEYKIICHITDNAFNNLIIERGTDAIAIPNDRIDEFIELLQKHSSSEGDGDTFIIESRRGQSMRNEEIFEIMSMVNGIAAGWSEFLPRDVLGALDEIHRRLKKLKIAK